MRPRRAGVKPLTERISVVLPIPLRPRIVTTWPGATGSDTPCRTCSHHSRCGRPGPRGRSARRRSCPEIDLAHHRVGLDLVAQPDQVKARSEEHTSELQSRGHLVCRLLLEKKKINTRSDFSVKIYALCKYVTAT